MDNVAIER